MREISERVESHITYVTDDFQAAVFANHCVLRTPLPCSGGYHLERGRIPLHDAVGINCKNGETTEKSRLGPFLVEGESRGILL